MKYYSGESLLKYKWDQVTTGFWNRYPNPQSAHILSEDTFCRKIVRGKLISSRIVAKVNRLPVPQWGAMFAPKSVYVVEESIVDPKRKTFTTYTRNIGYTKFMTIDEKCVYKPCPENKNWTVCERQAWIGSNFFGLAIALQTIGLERFKSHAGKSIKGFEHVLNKMYNSEQILDQPKPLSLQREKLKATAKNAKALAQSKAAPVVANAKALAQSNMTKAAPVVANAKALAHSKAAPVVANAKAIAQSKAAKYAGGSQAS